MLSPWRLPQILFDEVFELNLAHSIFLPLVELNGAAMLLHGVVHDLLRLVMEVVFVIHAGAGVWSHLERACITLALGGVEPDTLHVLLPPKLLQDQLRNLLQFKQLLQVEDLPLLLLGVAFGYHEAKMVQVVRLARALGHTGLRSALRTDHLRVGDGRGGDRP